MAYAGHDPRHDFVFAEEGPEYLEEEEYEEEEEEEEEYEEEEDEEEEEEEGGEGELEYSEDMEEEGEGEGERLLNDILEDARQQQDVVIPITERPRRRRRSVVRRRALIEEEPEEDAHDNEVVILDPTPRSVGDSMAVETSGDVGENGGEDVGCLTEGSRGTQADSSCVPTCQICMEQWTPEGVHRVCCIPCGHVYGRSCLERWLQRCGKTLAKCPQCSRNYRIKQIINLYAPQIAVASRDLEKEIKNLKEKNESLTTENKHLIEELLIHKKQAYLDNVSPGVTKMEPSSRNNRRQSSILQYYPESNFVSQNHTTDGSAAPVFVLQNELEIYEARVLDTDALHKIVVISRAASGLGGEHVLTILRTLIPSEMENVHLPPYIGAVRDLRLAPCNMILPGRLALLASLGKKLSMFSMESNNIVLKYDLPAPAWSCSWDFNNPDLVYAGLQNGSMMVFDIRQTSRPLSYNFGLSQHPVHTIHSLQNNHVNSSSKVVTTSSLGPCLWNSSSMEERPFLIPDMERYGVCISLACGGASDDMVASFRPKIVSNDITTSQPSQSSSPVAAGGGKLGTHVVLRRLDDNTFQDCQTTNGTVSELRMSRSVIISTEGSNPLFAYGDESYKGLCMRELQSLQVVKKLKPHEHPILDVKYSHFSGPGVGLLTCISKNKLQVFTCLGSSLP